MCDASLMDDSAESDRITAAVSEMLPTSVRPWRVRVDRNPHTGSWAVGLEHEASFGLGFDMGEQVADGDATIDRIRIWLGYSDHELRRVATAPALEHPDEVLDIRGLAHIFNWSKLEVSSVVRMVERWTLTAAEAEWLITSIGRDADPPSPSRDF